MYSAEVSTTYEERRRCVHPSLCKSISDQGLLVFLKIQSRSSNSHQKIRFKSSSHVRLVNILTLHSHPGTQTGCSFSGWVNDIQRSDDIALPWFNEYHQHVGVTQPRPAYYEQRFPRQSRTQPNSPSLSVSFV